MRGNVLDLAVGVIIGAAFGKIVGSLVNDILMPVVGLILGKIDFSNLTIAEVVKYGAFIQSIIDFLIIAFIIFLIVRSANKLKKAPPPADPTTKECPHCISTISIKATRCPNCTSELKA
ncbi:MAG: large conductance mechanosensitive channel protein MscL [Anaerolineales bacterium]|nr:large conductance mechanosensitive channel protein MscL [Anaerolineales bacterium]